MMAIFSWPRSPLGERMLRARGVPASPRIGLLWVLLASVALLPVLGDLALAHPLGNLTVNRYSRIEVARDEVTLRYVLDLAEIPTLQELNAAGLDQQASIAQVRQRLLVDKSAQLASRARLELGGHPVSWSIRERGLDMLEGQAGLRTLRIELTLAARVAVADAAALRYRDTSYADRVGWHEVVLRPLAGVRLDGSSVPDRDVSDELRAYPGEPARAPLDVSAAEATVRYGSIASTAGGQEMVGQASRPFAVDAAADHVTGFLRGGANGDVLALGAAVLLAAGIGAFHALTPGHGKTVMAAYLVGTGGTPRQALALGGIVALSHTAGVLGLGLVVLGASTVVAPDRFYPYLSALSAVIVLGIGVWLALGLLRRRAHDHAHEHGHDHAQDGSHGHDHGTDSAVGWRALVALGVSGGIIPSASALLLLLAAVSLRRPELGVVLVIAFGVGMAAVLIGIGLTLVGAGRIAARHFGGRPRARRVAALLPAATAGAVLLVGAGLSVQAGQQLLAALL